MYEKGKRENELYLCSLGKVVTCEFSFQSEFVHNPICFLSLWGSSSIEDKGLLHPHKIVLPFENLFVLPSGLPIPRLCCSIGSQPCWILPIPLAEEVPIFLPHLCFLYTPKTQFRSMENDDQRCCQHHHQNKKQRSKSLQKNKTR